MDNINNDIIKLTTLLKSTQNDYNESDYSDEELNLPKYTETPFLAESITNDEDTIFIIETCSDPLIKKALICNVKKRNILNDVIKSLEANILKIKNIQREKYVRAMSSTKLSKKLIIKKRLGIPYFKDSTFFPSPPNDDFITMQKNKHLTVLDCVKKVNWSYFHKYELVKTVYENVCTNKRNEITALIIKKKIDSEDKNILSEINDLQHKLKILNNTKLIATIAQQFQNITINTNGYIYIKNKLIEKSEDSHFIISLINNSKITSSDWQSISENNFDLKFTSTECESMWSCYLHPKYSKEHWKEFENTKLQELVAKWKYENWEAIAEELNTQRSAYQCCVHFYSTLYDKFNRTKWTVEEEQLLNELVETSRIGDHINWTKIAHYFKDRNKSQIYAHYYQAMIPTLTKGTFTIEEDVLLLTLLKLHNNDMKKAKLYFPSRSLSQLRDRFRTMSKDDSQDWTLKDDCKIIDHVQQHGAKKWYLLDDLNRSNACIRHRYITLKKWFEQNPNDDLRDVQRRFKNLYRKKIKIRFELLNAAVQQLLQLVKDNTADDKNILNLSYIYKNILNRLPLYKTFRKNKTNTSLYKNKSVRKKQKSLNSEGTLYNFCVNFFEPAFKKISRGKSVASSDDFTKKAKRVINILELLGAKINLPTNEDEIDNNIMLTNSDKNILHEMKKLQSSKDQSILRNDHLQLQWLIPPTPETLIGFRGLLLHLSTLRSHSRGHYEGYHYYVHKEQRFEKHGLNYIKRRNDIFLSHLNKNEKQIVLHERALFSKRMRILFSWPFIMQDIKIEPTIPEAPPKKIINITPTAPTPKPRKRGRPTRNNKSWKINLMNKARLDKKKQDQKKTISDPSDSDNSKESTEICEPSVFQLNNDLINLPSTSKDLNITELNLENMYEVTKHEKHSFSIKFKAMCSSGNAPEKREPILINATEEEIMLDSDDDLDEDVQKLLMQSKIDESKRNENSAVINQMSQAIKQILSKQTVEPANVLEKTTETEFASREIERNKRKTKIIDNPKKRNFITK